MHFLEAKSSSCPTPSPAKYGVSVEGVFVRLLHGRTAGSSRSTVTSTWNKTWIRFVLQSPLRLGFDPEPAVRLLAHWKGLPTPH